MNYKETLDYLYSRLPVFQNVGARAFKPGLDTTRALCTSLENPQDKYPTIHIAGTNGKGSSSHMLAAILQQSGYRVGLYTSPHLKDFRERIRVNGICVLEEFVISFTNSQQANIVNLSPSFFEVTVAMAFAYFKECEVDIAVIEVGMGGRLDSTNVITPELSLITNISLDHTQFLGETLAEIAYEKAGIIKPGVTVIVSEDQSEEINVVLREKAKKEGAPLSMASKLLKSTVCGVKDGLLSVDITAVPSGKMLFPGLKLDLSGTYQQKNILGVLAAKDALVAKGWDLPDDKVREALSSVGALTGLKGRWQLLQRNPTVYADTAHNVAGLQETIRQFGSLSCKVRRFVLGFVGDKDITAMLDLLPKDGVYYFCQPSNVRALKASKLRDMASKAGLAGSVHDDVNKALEAALNASGDQDAIYVGGSTFVVADLENL
jgi:dihydrofolate synthase / folylpolyglutamate synthase